MISKTTSPEGLQFKGEVFSDTTMRTLYATDASAYREMPELVIIAKDKEDIHKAIKLAKEKGSSIIQVDNFRIVLTRPPFADGYEITAVRPVKKLKLPLCAKSAIC